MESYRCYFATLFLLFFQAHVYAQEDSEGEASVQEGLAAFVRAAYKTDPQALANDFIAQTGFQYSSQHAVQIAAVFSRMRKKRPPQRHYRALFKHLWLAGRQQMGNEKLSQLLDMHEKMLTHRHITEHLKVTQFLTKFFESQYIYHSPSRKWWMSEGTYSFPLALLHQPTHRPRP